MKQILQNVLIDFCFKITYICKKNIGINKAKNNSKSKQMRTNKLCCDNYVVYSAKKLRRYPMYTKYLVTPAIVVYREWNAFYWIIVMHQMLTKFLSFIFLLVLFEHLNDHKQSEMGSKESKTVDSTGAVNNNLVLENEGFDIYSFELALLLLIIVIIKMVKLFVMLYQMHKRSLRKTYANRDANREDNPA